MDYLLLGHLNNDANKDLVYKEKPNNMGLPLGIIQNYNKSKGLITLKLKEEVEIGDTISLEKETGTYTISELMCNDKNITKTNIGQTVTIGRMKGNINLTDKVYKISSKALSTLAKQSYEKENRKVFLKAKITIKKDLPISIYVTAANNLDVYQDLDVNTISEFIPVEAKNRPLDKDSIIKQLSKTSNTPYEFKIIDIDLDDNLFLPKLSVLNELRRNILEQVEAFVYYNIKRIPKISTKETSSFPIDDNILSSMRDTLKDTKINTPKISLLLNILNINFDYSKLENIDNIYIPLKYFSNKKYNDILKTISNKFSTYIYLPPILKGNYQNLLYNHAETSVKKYDIKGFVLSNLSYIKLLHDLFEDVDKYFKLVANFNLNVFNLNTVLELKNLGISKFTLSPELDKKTIDNLCNYNYLKKELVVYGQTPLMNMNYCLLGKSNKCYPDCTTKCRENYKYFLKDRLNMSFPIIPDNLQTVTTIYNSKITSIPIKDFSVNSARIDILYENIDEINNISYTVKSGNRLDGKDYTNGNLYKEV